MRVPCSSPQLAPSAAARRAARGLLLLLAAMAAGLWAPATVAGQASQAVQIFGLSQRDLDGDGRPDVTVIDCSFSGERDTVTVYDRGGDMRPAQQWRQATDFENDLWVFDAGSDGNAELIISFGRTAEGLVAELWDDQDGDVRVRYTAPPELAIQESPWPSVRVMAPEGWWTRDGKTNFNLNLTVDGPITAAFQAPVYQSNLESDGAQDFMIRIRDTDHDGRPDYHWTNAFLSAPVSWGSRRNELMVNPDDDEPPLTGSIFWPYLGDAPIGPAKLAEIEQLHGDSEASATAARRASGYTKSYGVSRPPIKVVWKRSVIGTVGEFVSSRFNDNSWFVYSIYRAKPGEAVETNFEAPFAFYDLAADDDGYPELQIRFEHYLAHDRYLVRTVNPEPLQIIRYSWDQDNNRSWDYKLGLIGRHEITSTVTIDDLTLKMLPPRSLPEWIMERAWDGATFVAAEYPELWTSEGIYEWGPSEAWMKEYATGSVAEPPAEDFQELPVRLRGELAFNLQRDPRLYFSPVDRKLHLLGAQSGLWRVSELDTLRYKNLGGEHLNQWSLFQGETLAAQLNFAVGYVVYADGAGVSLTRTDAPPALFTAIPPRDHTEWLALGRQLEASGAGSPPENLRAAAAQFGPPESEIIGATMRDFRLDGGGFRFLLDLQPGASADGPMRETLDDREPGSYVVTYDGSFAVTPLEPPRLGLDLQVRADESALFIAPVPIRIQATNSGLADVAGASLVIFSSRGGAEEEIARRPIDLLAGGDVRLTVSWQPARAGRWEVGARIESAEGDLLVANVREAVELSATSPAPNTILAISNGSPVLGAAAVLLLAIAALAGAVARATMRAS
jgi:hypothetical protein